MKKYSCFVKVFLIMCLGCVFALLCRNPHALASGAQYISEVSTGIEDEGRDALNESGFIGFTPSIVDGSGRNIWIGYKTTEIKSNAATDIRIKGSSGDFGLEAVKERGKAAVMAIKVVSADTNSVPDFDDVYPLCNNGLVPVKDSSGKVVTYNTINGKCYLALVKSDVWKNYVGDIKVVKENSKKAAITALAELGCEFYVDKNLSSKDSSYVYTGYIRTADEKEAVTDIVGLSRKDIEAEGYELISDIKIRGCYLYISHDEKYGNPLVDIEYIADFESMDITAKQWTDMVMGSAANSSAKSYILESDDYRKMIDSKDKYTINRIYTDEDVDTGLVITSVKNDLDEKQSSKKELIGGVISNAGSAPEEPNEDEMPVDGNVYSEDTGAENAEGTGVDEYVVEEGDIPESDESADGTEGSEGVTSENAEGEGTVEDTRGSAENTEGPVEDTEGVGTVSETGGRLPGIVEIIIFILLVITIPVVTYFIKRRIDRS